MRSSDSDDSPDLAVLISFSGQGGVERMVLNLLEELARRGFRIDLLPIRRDFRADEFPPGINVVSLGARHSRTSVLPLIGYLRKKRPAVMLVAKDRAARAAVEAGVKTHTQTYPLGEANAALADLKHSRIDGAGVLIIDQS